MARLWTGKKNCCKTVADLQPLPVAAAADAHCGFPHTLFSIKKFSGVFSTMIVYLCNSVVIC